MSGVFVRSGSVFGFSLVIETSCVKLHRTLAAENA